MKRKILVAVLTAFVLSGCTMPDISFDNADSPLFVGSGKEEAGQDTSIADQTVTDDSASSRPTESTAVDSSESKPAPDTSDVSVADSAPKDQSDSSAADISTKDESSVPADISEPTDSKTDKEEKDSKPAAAIVDPVQLGVQVVFDSEYSYGSNSPKHAAIHYSWLQLDERSEDLCPDLEEVLDDNGEQLSKQMESDFTDLKTAAEKAAGKNNSEYLIERTTLPVRADNLAFSALAIVRDTQGKSTETTIETLNLDSQTGKEIALEDVIDTKDLAGLLTKAYEDTYPDDPVTAFEKTVSGYADDDYVWAISREGVNFYFLDDSDENPVTVQLLRKENEDIFTDLYADVPEVYVLPISDGFATAFDKDDDGITDLISVQLNKDNGSVTVDLNGNSAVGRFDTFAVTPVLVRTAEEGYYIYMSCRLDNDYEQLAVFDITDDKPVFIGLESNAGFPAVYDEDEETTATVMPGIPEEFSLVSDMNLLSTYGAIRSYEVGKDGMPEALDEWYHPDADVELTVVTSFVADIINPKTDRVMDEGVSIAKGTKVKIYRTDGKSVVDLESEDDEIIRVDVDTSGGWPQTIDGTDIEKLFDGIRFAG